ncbi:hypothetical protein Q8A67_012846 [Cirrhinus molitorella]|uniref:Uncharacterized protein n=1 Tax=Cirrhinus molitorella TaxID=172907 RepID=A0AA88PVB1_9TELE|nr:hypothetical protein Q8A67_012846 [Cirrhinus molitorella]
MAVIFIDRLGSNQEGSGREQKRRNKDKGDFTQLRPSKGLRTSRTQQKDLEFSSRQPTLNKMEKDTLLSLHSGGLYLCHVGEKRHL